MLNVHRCQLPEDSSFLEQVLGERWCLSPKWGMPQGEKAWGEIKSRLSFSSLYLVSWKHEVHRKEA
jgi:hypothetical protein